MAELTQDEEKWYERAAKAIAPAVKATYESDWMEAANCQVGHHDDRFIRKPSLSEAPIWERICKQCPVSMQCMEWADRHDVTGVFIAGEWRE